MPVILTQSASVVVPDDPALSARNYVDFDTGHRFILETRHAKSRSLHGVENSQLVVEYAEQTWSVNFRLYQWLHLDFGKTVKERPSSC